VGSEVREGGERQEREKGERGCVWGGRGGCVVRTWKVGRGLQELRQATPCPPNTAAVAAAAAAAAEAVDEGLLQAPQQAVELVDALQRVDDGEVRER